MDYEFDMDGTDVDVVSVEASGSYNGSSTVKVTLQRGDDFAICDDIVIWDEDLVDSDLFDEWVSYAKAGGAGYTAVIVEGNETVLYCK